jgi:hypothetical protein
MYLFLIWEGIFSSPAVAFMIKPALPKIFYN